MIRRARSFARWAGLAATLAVTAPEAVAYIDREPVKPRPADFCAGCGRQRVFRLQAAKAGPVLIKPEARRSSTSRGRLIKSEGAAHQNCGRCHRPPCHNP